ncbi:MAG: hypothetical protein R6X27_09210 [Candidatus Desulfacyla sp.]
MAITQNECSKAQRFRDAQYLYPVMNAGVRQKLYVVRNRAESLAPEERLEVVRYVVPLEQIRIRGENAA